MNLSIVLSGGGETQRGGVRMQPATRTESRIKADFKDEP